MGLFRKGPKGPEAPHAEQRENNYTNERLRFDRLQARAARILQAAPHQEYPHEANLYYDYAPAVVTSSCGSDLIPLTHPVSGQPEILSVLIMETRAAEPWARSGLSGEEIIAQTVQHGEVLQSDVWFVQFTGSGEPATVYGCSLNQQGNLPPQGDIATAERVIDQMEWALRIQDASPV